MGSSILELVLEVLRNGGFQADVAYPAQRHPVVTEPVAAVHILEADSAKRTVTAEVCVICGVSLGGARCETEALEAARLLSEAGAEYVLKGCEHDGVHQTYCVRIQAVFREETVLPALDFQVYAGEELLPHVVMILAEKVTENQINYTEGENAPASITQGKWSYAITLEELVPPGEVEVVPANGGATLTITGENGTEVYNGCCWGSVKRELTRNGLHQIRKGHALGKE